jgi:hypothetical protein
MFLSSKLASKCFTLLAAIISSLSRVARLMSFNAITVSITNRRNLGAKD